MTHLRCFLITTLLDFALDDVLLLVETLLELLGVDLVADFFGLEATGFFLGGAAAFETFFASFATLVGGLGLLPRSSVFFTGLVAGAFAAGFFTGEGFADAFADGLADALAGGLTMRVGPTEICFGNLGWL